MNGAAEGPAIPRYSVAELNGAVANLLERGFAPRFLLDATVSRPQLKKGHLWMTLVDEQASISAVVWASQLGKLSFLPKDGDGVVVVGKLNFWSSRASLCVQALDIRPSLSSVLRQFEQVRDQLAGEGLLDPGRKRSLPAYPLRIALLTSRPSSALADMLRTAAERWPATSIVVVPIPVQGPVHVQICQALLEVGQQAEALGIEAVVIGRGGGSREDLAVFDNEELARCLAACPVPVVSGIGHEDDTTVADLVADYRAATPTAALVALLPDRSVASQGLQQQARHLSQMVHLRLQSERGRLTHQRERLLTLHPRGLITSRRQNLDVVRQLLQALSPEHQLVRGYSLLRGKDGKLVRSIQQLQVGHPVMIELSDGQAGAEVREIHPHAAAPTGTQP
ncbi:MAG: exodeoxyribonuclease VII large subunit [Cyanobium sp.]